MQRERVYPYTIDNGGGELLTFTRRVQDAEGERVEGGNVVSPGSGPPMHVHFLQEEGFTVRKGRIGYQRAGQEPAYATEGESVVFRAGEPHRFWNAGDVPLECDSYITPPGNVEYFLEALFTSQKNNGGRPDMLDIAYLIRRYRTEFAMLEIPAIVQRVAFPIMIALGRLLGRYDKYADAPEPLTADSIRSGADQLSRR
jgi:mannose-6-phosphate isomerase-like protein (cupin superfamily)